MRQTVFLLLVLFLASCASVPSTRRGRMEADIREAVFRYQFSEWKQPGAGAFFLDVSGENADPSDEFLRRFDGCHPSVKKISQCKIQAQGDGVNDTETGAKGVVFRAGAITWKNDLEARVSGGFYENGRRASGNTYTVRYENGRWKVTEDQVLWIARAEYLELNHAIGSI